MCLPEEARVSVKCFGAGICIILPPVFGLTIDMWTTFPSINGILLVFFYFLIINVAFYVLLNEHLYQVAIRASFLGIIFGLGILVTIFSPPSWRVFGWYMCVMSFFHYSEYVTIAATNPKTLSLHSFLLNHSREYGIAAACSWGEFFIERWLFPGLKQVMELSLIGLFLCLFGEFLRKLAMLTARTNFNHVIQDVQEDGHVLVTHGIYSVFRHPSYVGWFYWSVGTQVILCNPVCMIGYTIVTWQFFNERINAEEVTLLNFFGEDYYKYQMRVRTGLPFIEGFKLE